MKSGLCRDESLERKLAMWGYPTLFSKPAFQVNRLLVLRIDSSFRVWYFFLWCGFSHALPARTRADFIL
jgi:hypothetical protein